MSSKFHFISGLPRSGSTLLSALLKQNPKFHASVTSPVAPLINALHPKMCGGEFGSFFDDERRARVLRGVFNTYYPPEGEAATEIWFDTNRSWTGRIALLNALFPEAKVICCVRDIGWIIDSIELMLKKNPMQLSRIFNFSAGASLYSRVDNVMNPEKGLVGLAWHNLREAWFGTQANNLIVIPYDSFIKNPEQTLKNLYLKLGLDYFQHSFTNVSFEAEAFDQQLGMPGLHTIRQNVEQIKRIPIIPPDVFVKYDAFHFWKDPAMNPRGVTIL
ncbi:sulfotransferase [Duganella sp. FT109W]|uniref:Sulfotransferase n=1 Tax=Duganella margarita TaxID=2692170 RepID=A0ABW9WJ68_9BURK|nr:sulfotransferase [Duganella margarita]MYN40369.1 sulfotransferase [Duganella margarita]